MVQDCEASSDKGLRFVGVDMNSDRVSVGRALDLPVYFGDAGSKEVLQACCSGFEHIRP